MAQPSMPTGTWQHGGARKEVAPVGTTLIGGLVRAATSNVPFPVSEKAGCIARNKHFSTGPIRCPDRLHNFKLTCLTQGSKLSRFSDERNLYTTYVDIRPLSPQLQLGFPDLIDKFGLYDAVMAMDQVVAEQLVQAFPTLVPNEWSDVATVRCDCPHGKELASLRKPECKDWCKHITGAFEILIKQCDQQAYTIFKMRGVDVYWLAQIALTNAAARVVEPATKRRKGGVKLEPGTCVSEPICLDLDQ